MDISKLTRVLVTDESQQLQSIDTQTMEEQTVGFAQGDSVENGSDQQGLSAFTGSGGTTALGQSGEGQTASASYAEGKDKSSEAEESKNDASIRTEVAGALGPSESSPVVDQVCELLIEQKKGNQAENARLEANQQTIDDALMYGRRVEQNLKVGDKDVSMFTEYVVPASGDFEGAVVRMGTDITEHGWFSDTTTRFTNYFDASGHKLGVVKSVIEDGEEKITKVIEYVPGSIDMKEGDTRKIPDPGSTTAGKRPETWDPKADGSYG